MKIAVLCVPFDDGKSGISVYTRSLVEALKTLGHETVLITEPGDAKFFPRQTPIELPGWTRRAIFSMFYCLFILPFRLRKLGCDFCVIAAGNRRAFAFYPLFTIAVIHDLANFHIAGKYDPLRMFYLRWVLPFFISRADALVAISRSTANDMRRFWPLPAQKEIRVIYNGLPVPPKPRDGWMERCKLKPNGYLLYISRIEHPGKNHCNLIRAFELLPPELSYCKLVIAGADWGNAEAVHRRAEESPRREDILFTGFLENADLAEAYTGAASYVFPSFFEGFGLSLIEAMHCGTPCCCSNNSSLGEIGEGAAMLFDPADPATIAEAIRRILTEKELREQLIEAGHRRAAEFDWKKHARGVVELYEQSRVSN